MDGKFKIDFEKLPVYVQKQRILDALQSNQIIVVESNTGSGKTTQIPIILHEAGYTANGQVIGMTQPRRIAAFSISEVMRAQLQFQYPDLPDNFVQYKIRFEDLTTPETQVKLMTDGILLQEIKHDKLLSAYSVLIIDEAHERSLNIDFILGLLRNICQDRPDLKIIISSATINTKKFSEYFFGNCPIISIDAPSFEVDIRYVPIPDPRSGEGSNGNSGDGVQVAHSSNADNRGGGRDDSRESKRGDRRGGKGRQFYGGSKDQRGGNRSYGGNRGRNGNNRFSHKRIDELFIEHLVEVVKQSLAKKEGDILIFLAGEKHIKDCLEKLSMLPNADATLHLLPLYGRLDHEQQQKVFDLAPEGKTKIIAATNIAETSITIDKIGVVIDTGKVKLNYYHYQRFSSSLLEMSISRASAVQRRGRAGRTAPGVCYRLYSEDDFNQMKPFSSEEILRTDLSEIVLRMAHLGVTDFEHFNFISSPPRDALTTAVALLQDMRAIDQERYITEIGILMIQFPLSPAHARILVEAMQKYPDVLSHVIIILSFLTTASPFLLPLNEELEARKKHHRFASKDSDFFTYIKLFETYKNTVYEDKPNFCHTHYLDLRVLNEIVNIHTQLADMVSEQGVFVGTQSHEDQIIKSALKGLIYNLNVQSRGSTYLSRTGEKIYIHPGSVMFDVKDHPQIVIAAEVVQTSKVFARALSECKIEWIRDDFPHMYEDIKKLLRMISSKSYAQQQKFREKLETHQALYSISANSAMDNIESDSSHATRTSGDKTRESKDTRKNGKSKKTGKFAVQDNAQEMQDGIQLGNKEFFLSTSNLGVNGLPLSAGVKSRNGKNNRVRVKVLAITWDEAIYIVKHTSIEALQAHNWVRCDISYNVHAVLAHIKLVNVPIMYTIYGDKLPFVPHVPEVVCIEKIKKKSHVVDVINLLQESMHILIPKTSARVSTKLLTQEVAKFFSRDAKNSSESVAHKQHSSKRKNVAHRSGYKFLALQMDSVYRLYLIPEGSFIKALQDSIHTLGVISDIGEDNTLSLPNAVSTEIKNLYARLFRAYENKYENKDV